MKTKTSDYSILVRCPHCGADNYVVQNIITITCIECGKKIVVAGSEILYTNALKY